MKVLPLSHKYCKISIPGDPDTKVCAEGSYVTGKTPCDGDSGGPLFISHDGHYKLIGITSYIAGTSKNVVLFPGISYLQEEETCQDYLTSVYTKVNQYVDWIENQIGGIILGFMYYAGCLEKSCIKTRAGSLAALLSAILSFGILLTF